MPMEELAEFLQVLSGSVLVLDGLEGLFVGVLRVHAGTEGS